MIKKIFGISLMMSLLILSSCSNEKPLASFSVSKTGGCYPLTIAFDAGASQDTDGEIKSYSWDFGDSQSGTGKTVSHTYSSIGTYVASLTIKDDSDDSATASKTITISSVDGQWRGTATTITSHNLQDSFGVTMMILQSLSDPTVLNGTAVWDHLPGIYFSGSGTLDTSNNLLSMTWTASGFHSYTTIGNYSDDCHSFTGVIDGSSFTNDPFDMTWLGLAPSSERIESAAACPEGNRNVAERDKR